MTIPNIENFETLQRYYQHSGKRVWNTSCSWQFDRSSPAFLNLNFYNVNNILSRFFFLNNWLTITGQTTSR